jgi:hypothetical protein
MKSKWIVLVGMVAVGCYTAPPLVEFEDKFTTSADFQKTWTAVIEILSADNWPIEAIEKESGLITTGMVRLGFDGKKGCSCPGGPFSIFEDYRSKISIFVKMEGGRTSFRTRYHIEGLKKNVYTETIEWIPCNSLGVFEKALSQRILNITGP